MLHRLMFIVILFTLALFMLVKGLEFSLGSWALGKSGISLAFEVYWALESSSGTIVAEPVPLLSELASIKTWFSILEFWLFPSCGCNKVKIPESCGGDWVWSKLWLEVFGTSGLLVLPSTTLFMLAEWCTGDVKL